MSVYALLWSHSENAVRVEPFEEALSIGRKAYTDDAPAEWAILFAGRHEDVSAAANNMRQTIESRSRKVAA